MSEDSAAVKDVAGANGRIESAGVALSLCLSGTV
jgi:hypothetical protein